jgi:hypothetical protein
MFWIILGAIIALSSGLLALNIVRSRLRYFIPKITDNYIEYLRMALLFIGVAMTVSKGIDSYILNNKLQTELRSTKIDLKESNNKFQKFQEKVSDRRAPRNKVDEFIRKLSREKEEGITIQWISGNEEAHNFANEIIYIFQVSGWKTKSASVTIIGGSPLFGAEILPKNKDMLKKAVYIASVLDFIKFTIKPINEKMKENLVMTIGSKKI